MRPGRRQRHDDDESRDVRARHRESRSSERAGITHGVQSREHVRRPGNAERADPVVGLRRRAAARGRAVDAVHG